MGNSWAYSKFIKYVYMYTCRRHYSAIFKIISQCNDFCDFCLEYKFIKSGRPPLSLEEFKKNYFYLKKKFHPDYVILTGGEPTLHPQFFEILDFLKKQRATFRIITNLLKFNEKDFLKKLKVYFSNFRGKKQASQSKIIVSINDLSEKGRIAKERFEGLKKALKLGLPLMITTVIYRDNLKDLPEISKRLKNLFRRYATDGFLHIEFRMIYIEGTSPELLKKSLPINFQKVKNSVEAAMRVLDVPKVNVTLWNFPLCYLDNPIKFKDKSLIERQVRRLIKIHKNAQLKNAQIRNWEIYLKKNLACQKCSLNNYCSGIDQAYIRKYDFPQLRPIL